MATTKFKGSVVNLGTNSVSVGEKAPIVKVVGKDLSDIQIGGEQGVVQIVVAVPSLDTDVCAMEAKKFNVKAASIQNAQLILISMDLPFAMGRFCQAEGIENVKVASDFRAKEFAKAYGVLIEDGVLTGLTARAVFVIDASGVITYKEIVAEIADEPDYEAALKAINEAASTCCGS
ncbi:thiol peroxidase Prx-SUH [Campylobacter curvus]|uniref:Thiol peroxidase n=1 Tax=Campylobacter curvus (strain 525.92) TaxID=360105 RepID=A7H0P5_CAMC5|nr:thiol peroxidase [Campylobacter curvus]EAU01409.1 lipid hydroperoxide peroxidase [Campylobacter curvus 525.92]